MLWCSDFCLGTSICTSPPSSLYQSLHFNRTRPRAASKFMVVSGGPPSFKSKEGVQVVECFKWTFESLLRYFPGAPSVNFKYFNIENCLSWKNLNLRCLTNSCSDFHWDFLLKSIYQAGCPLTSFLILGPAMCGTLNAARQHLASRFVPTTTITSVCFLFFLGFILLDRHLPGQVTIARWRQPPLNVSLDGEGPPVRWFIARGAREGRGRGEGEWGRASPFGPHHIWRGHTSSKYKFKSNTMLDKWRLLMIWAYAP